MAEVSLAGYVALEKTLLRWAASLILNLMPKSDPFKRSVGILPVLYVGQ